MRALAIRANSTFELLTDDTKMQYPDLNRRLLGDDEFGGMVEQVHAYHLINEYGTLYGSLPRVIMLVNENGIALELPYNANATVLYAPEAAQQAHRGGNLAIFGDAFLIGQDFDPEEGADWADLPDTVNVASVKGLVTRLM